MTNHERESSRSFFGALIATLTLIGCGTYLVATGHDNAGIAFIGTTVIGLAGTFLTGKKLDKTERAESRHDLIGPE